MNKIVCISLLMGVLAGAARAAVPTPPAWVSASDALHTNRIAVTWPASSGATSYEVWRTVQDNIAYAVRLTNGVTTTNYDDMTAMELMEYSYRIKAVNVDGPSGFSPGDPGSRLCAPAISVSQSIYPDRIRLLWDTVIGATGYEVWRSTNTSQALAVMIGTNVTTTYYDDRSGIASIRYEYWVRTRNGALTSAFSPISGGQMLGAATILSNDTVWAAGTRVISTTVLVKAGCTLTIQPGAVIQLATNAAIEVFGSLVVDGVRFGIIPGQPYGGGILVEGDVTGRTTSASCSIRNSDFSGLGAFFVPYNSVAIWLRAATVEVSSCTFSNFLAGVIRTEACDVRIIGNTTTNTGEGLNAVNSRGLIVSNTISVINGYADGIDLDGRWAGAGEDTIIIEYNHLKDASDYRADAIDLGGALSLVRFNRIERFSDKGLSVGEFTKNTHVAGNIIRQCGMGLVTKDFSDPVFENNTIVGCGVGIAGYKKYWGPATGSVVNCILWNCATNLLLTDGSAVQVSGTCAQGIVLPGSGNISNAPAFVAEAQGNFHLSAGSACIDAGVAGVQETTDMEHTPRPLDGNNDGSSAHDIGSYEYVSPVADSDADGMPDASEIAADTSPLNPASALKITNVVTTAGGIQVSWQGGVQALQILMVRSELETGTNGWQAVFTNLPPVTQSVFTVTGTNARSFYQLRARRP